MVSLVKQISGCVFNIWGPIGETFKFTPVAIINIIDMMWDSSPPTGSKSQQKVPGATHYTTLY